MCFVFHGFGQGLKAMSKTARRCLRALKRQQRLAILPWRSSLSDANGQFMAPVPLSAAVLPPHEQAARYASASNRAGHARTDVNGGY
jgi:hypothetical protein